LKRGIHVERNDALGFIETYGLVSVLEAADAMCKAADVELVGYENVASGLISVVVRGDVGAVRTAVEAGIKAASKVGKIYSTNVIARPHPDIEKIIARYVLDW
jgi:microcompartment protein CcmL/EutN